LNDERFRGHPGILETPKDTDPDDDRRNMATLRELAGMATVTATATPAP
jgi:hypothetical protein